MVYYDRVFYENNMIIGPGDKNYSSAVSDGAPNRQTGYTIRDSS